MNATGMSKIGKLAIGLVVTLTASTALAQQLDRSSVDTLLAQARTAIETGDFTQADQLISRCEAAGVRYPLIHFGDTPSSLRRELTRARNQNQQQLGTSDDPFAAVANSLPQLPESTTNPIAAGQPSNGYPTSTPGTPQPLQVASAPRTLPGAATPPEATPKATAIAFMQQSRAALASNDLNAAAQLAARASALNVPESEFAENEDRPSQLAWDIEQRRFGGVVQPAVADMSEGNVALQAVYNGDANGGVNGAVEPASATNPFSTPRLAQASGVPQQLPTLPAAEPLFGGTASQLIDQGEAALRDGDRASALEFFRQADARRGELAADRLSRLDDHLKMFNTGGSAEALTTPPAYGGSMLAEADEQQQVLARQLSNDVGKATIDAREMLQRDPKGALEKLKKTRSQVAGSSLIDKNRAILISRIDDEIGKVEAYVDANRAQLELDERNADILAEIDRGRELKVEMQTKIAELIDQWNQLRDEQRYAEMDIVAKRLYEMAPDHPVVAQVWQNNKFIYRLRMNQQIANAKEDALWKADADIEGTSYPLVSDGAEVRLSPNWLDLKSSRRSSSELTESRSVRELEIMQSLKKPVMIRYENQPLSAVMDDLSKMTGVNIVLDPRGLTQEGIGSDTRVSFAVNREISLRSALNLILEPLHLSYVVKDEVLKITSEQLRDGELKSRVYNVADLVIPIPNFVPSNNIGLQGLINDAYSATGVANGGLGAPGPLVLANNARRGAASGAGFNAASTPESVLAQPQFGGQTPGGFASPSNIPIGGGPGNLGGAAAADFDSLIDLIVSTVAADSWAENGGGEAEIRPFPTNLSIVISQTEAVHEEIADLLTQLRKLQDLQITIEVRFIRLNDSFFERIGIDFDVNIEDRSLGTQGLTQGESPEPPFSSATVGLQPSTGLNDFPNYTADLDIPFRQDSFNLAVPQFGTPIDVATFGFAILSDIEAYFLINASQGDRRSNVLNAPKVTLFNGQQAFVADTSQTPFVISVIPVVGEFAAAQQPVIVVLSEGTLMTIQAVVSDDRRYVRLTVVPFFSEIGDVTTFTFEGTTSTSTSSSTTDDNDDGNNNSGSNANNIIRSGTTVQLPTFQFVSVTTTVSVPDGGTVLLGGIKRLSEGRNEFGVPLLSKVPYINRLFKNVGIGRETDSLMMMVTPRIIIQEEEEARLLGTNP